MPASGDGAGLGLRVHRPSVLRTGVKPSQHFRDVPELILHTAAFFHQRGQPARVGVAAHDDDGFSGPSGGVVEMRDAQVGLRRQPTVEQDLAGAGLLAAVGGAEVQEVGRDRFLRLVRLIGDEHDDTGVCFVYLRVGARRQRDLLHGLILRRRERWA